MPVTRNIKTADNKTQTKNKIKNTLAFYKSSGFNANSWGDVRTDYNALNPDNTIANREAASSFLTKLNTANNIIDNPPVNANFVHNSFTKDGSTSTFDEMFTFSATTNRTMYDSTGVLVWAPHNTLTYSEDFTNAAWSNTDTTDSANTQEAPDGETTADTVTASAGNGTITQSWTAVAADYTFAVWLKRKTGTGNIQIAADDGTWTTVTITSSWALYTVEQTTTAGSKNAGIRIVTSGDEVYAWGAHLYRSDLGGMADNPDQGSGFETYIPTTTAAVYAARRNAHYYGGGWTNGGLLLEHAASTNAIADSNSFSGWTVARSSFSSAAATGPDGVSGSAWKFVEDGSNDGHYAFSYSAATPTDKYWVWSCYIKDAGDSRYICLRFRTLGGTSPFLRDVVFDPTDGSAYNPTGLLETGYEDIGNGWFRVWATAYVGDATSFLMPLIGLSNVAEPAVNPAAPTYQGDGSSGVYIYGMQFEEGKIPTSYIPTTGSTVTRAAENLTMPSAVTPIKKESGTMMFDALVSYTSDSPGARVFGITTVNDVYLRSVVSSYSRWSGNPNSAVTESGGLIPHGINQHARVSFAYSENVREMLSVNGTTGHYTNTTTLSNYSSTDISAFYAGSAVSAFFREMSLWDVDLGNTTNLAPKSEDFTDWIAEYSLTLDHAATTIDGISFTRWNTGAASRQSARRTHNTTSNDKTISFYAKADGGQFFQVVPNDGGSNRCHAVFDLTNGTVTETFAIGTHTIVSTGITDVGNDVYRCRLTYNTTDSSQDIYMIVPPTGTPGGFPITSPGENNDILIGGFQIEAGTELTDYVKKPSFNGGLEYLSGDPYEVDGYHPELVADFVGNTIEKPYYRYDGAETDFSSLFTFSATTNRTMFDEYGNLVWAPHNLAVNSDTPATQTITVLSGVKYTIGMTGSGSFVLSGGGSGTATENNPVQITTSSTSLTITLNGSATRVWVYRSDLGGMADNPDQPLGLEKYVPTGASVVYAARRDAYRYDSTAGEWVNGGLMLETAAATNDIDYSDLTAGTWTTSTRATWTPNSVTANGLSFGLQTKTSASEGAREYVYNPTPAGTALVRFIVKQGNTDWVFVGGTGEGAGGFRQYFNLTTGAKGTAAAYGSDSINDAFIEPLGDGVFSLAVAVTVGNWRHILRAAPCDSDNSSVGAIGSTLYVAHCDYIQGATVPSSPIITIGSTVTRAVETLDIPPIIHGLTNQPFSIQVKYVRGAPSTFGDRVMNLRNGSRITEIIDYRNSLEFYSINGNRDGSPVSLSNTIGETVNVAAYTNNSATEIALNGTASNSPGPGLNANTTWAPTTMLFGRYYVPNYELPTSFFQEIRLWKQSLDQGAIETVTQN